MKTHTLPTTDQGKATRLRILKASLCLFNQRGYDGVSIQDIASACDIQKPTIFHYTSSKMQLALEAIDLLNMHCQEKVFQQLNPETSNPAQHRAELISLAEAYFTQQSSEELPPTLATELMGIDPQIDESIRQHIDQWKHLFAYFDASNDIAHTYHFATVMLLKLQGALTFSRLYNSKSYIKDVFSEIRSYQARVFEKLAVA